MKGKIQSKKAISALFLYHCDIYASFILPFHIFLFFQSFVILEQHLPNVILLGRLISLVFGPITSPQRSRQSRVFYSSKDCVDRSENDKAKRAFVSVKQSHTFFSGLSMELSGKVLTQIAEA